MKGNDLNPNHFPFQTKIKMILKIKKGAMKIEGN
jgi:hypothetical protein